MRHNRRTGRFITLASLLFGLWLHVSAAEQQTGAPVFRGGTNTVEVTAVVSDRRGNPVRGLNREDFIVEEEGVPQAINVFSAVDLARTVAGEALGDTSAKSLLPGNASQTRRSYVLVLDPQHVDPSRSNNVRQLAKRFINNFLYEGDAAAVLTLGSQLGSEFTNDKKRLLASLESFVGGKSGSAATNIMMWQARDSGKSSIITPRDSENAVKAAEARAFFDSLRKICDVLGNVSGTRRAIVLFSEGLEIDMNDLLGPNPTMGGAEQLRTSLPSTFAAELLLAQKSMLDAAQRSSVALYTFDPRGSNIGDETLMQVAGLPDVNGKRVPPPTRDVQQEVRRSQDTLRLFATQTGGFAVVNTNDFERGFRRVVDANSSYYVLGYTSAATGTGFRKISVRVSRKDVEVIARPGYFPAAKLPLDKPQSR